MSSVRIIAGRWRGRRLPVVDAAGLRPTTDRVRETLFNWLQADLVGARCLDLYAGTGALGFEALSRGAASVTLVERNPRVLRQLRASAELLGAGETAHIVRADALAWLRRGHAGPFDLAFIDPPYADAQLEAVLGELDRRALLANGGRVYIEHGRQQPVAIGAPWTSLRSGHAGGISYHLLALERIG